MTLDSYTSDIPTGVLVALSEFEREFTYPLGGADRFKISHGDDYLRFFRSMGDATLLVAGHEGEITGSIARVKKSLRLRRDAGGPVETLSAHYLCDLKVRADCRGTLILSRLIRETKRQIEASDSHACYSVVMGGTGRLPTDYTGRLGVPKFEHLADITILRLMARASVAQSVACGSVALPEYLKVREAIGQTGYEATMRDESCRSESEPAHRITGYGDACGIIGDTRRAKRLILDSGEEMVSAHLSGFRYKTPEAAGLFLTDAGEFAGAGGFPAVFTAVPSSEMACLRPWLAGMEVTEAPAAVYGIGMERGVDWWIDTAEI